MDKISQLKDPIPISTLLFTRFKTKQKDFDRLLRDWIISINIAIEKCPLDIK